MCAHCVVVACDAHDVIMASLCDISALKRSFVHGAVAAYSEFSLSHSLVGENCIVYAHVWDPR